MLTKVVNGKTVTLSEEEETARRAEWAYNLNKYMAEKDLKEVHRLRKIAYGKIEDQLDFIVHNGISAFIQRNQEIKNQLPLPIKEVI